MQSAALRACHNLDVEAGQRGYSTTATTLYSYSITNPAGQGAAAPERARGPRNGRLRTELVPDLHLVIDQVQRELCEGYRLVSHLILNGIRVLLHRIATVLGDSAVAVRTDCVYTTLTEPEARQKLQAVSFWHDVGRNHTSRPPELVLEQEYLGACLTPCKTTLEVQKQFRMGR